MGCCLPHKLSDEERHTISEKVVEKIMPYVNSRLLEYHTDSIDYINARMELDKTYHET
jgi:hypothetical protein